VSSRAFQNQSKGSDSNEKIHLVFVSGCDDGRRFCCDSLCGQAMFLQALQM
jgi:hypothetical protein